MFNLDKKKEIDYLSLKSSLYFILVCRIRLSNGQLDLKHIL